MAKIYSSTMDLKAIFKSTAKAPLDNRQVVSSVADLTTEGTFEGYAYDGMLVIVAATGDAYILKDAANVTTAASWIKLATDSSAAAAASEVKSYEAQASYIEIDETTDQTDGHKIYTVELKTVDVANATSESTGLADAYQVKSYVDSAISGVENIIEENEEVVAAALNDLNDKIEDAATDAEITIAESTQEEGVAKRYTISQGGSAIGTIDIPKDLVVDEGKVVDVTWGGSGDQHYYDGSTNVDEEIGATEAQKASGELAGKYIRLKIANSTDVLYIAAKDLVDIYTEGSGINISNNEISVDTSDSDIQGAIESGSTKFVQSGLIFTALSGKVDKVTGKQLSTEDYTSAEKSKLAAIAEGAQVNVIESVKVNGTALTPDGNKAVDVTVPTNLTDLTNDGNFVQDASYVHTDNNYTTAEKTKLAGIDERAQVNVIESITVNGNSASITEKAASITIPEATTSASGVMSATDKTKLDSIASGAQVNVIESIVINGSAVTPENKVVDLGNIATTAEIEEIEEVTSAALNDLNSRLEDAEGDIVSLQSDLSTVENKLNGVESGAQVNVIEGVKLTDSASALTPDADKIVTIPAASASQDGLMSSEDYSRLSGVAAGAQVNIIETIKVDGVALSPDANKAVDIDLSGKVDKVTGKQLSTEDYTSAEKTKLSGIEEGAEKNIIEGVKVNGTPLVVDASRSVDVVIPSAPEYTIVKAASAETGYLATYNLTKDGTNTGASINIPKDFLVKSASMGVCETAGIPATTPALEVGDPYLDFVINTKDGSGSDEHIYINVKGLVDVYTAGNGIDIVNNAISVDTTDATIQGAIAENSTQFVQSGAIYTALSGKVDKTTTIAGVDLQDNVTAAELRSALNVAEGAEVNVQSDWNEADTTSDSYIANKPYIVKSYITNAITSGTSTTIDATTHGCGTFPLVQVYSGNEVVTANISVDTSTYGDVTVTWEITPSATNPIRIRIVG